VNASRKKEDAQAAIGGEYKLAADGGTACGIRVERVGEGEIPYWPQSAGEVHAFFWFMQGSIMIPEIRHRLWAAWGFCERHAWGHLAVEAAFRPRFLMGPSILYLDLIDRALACLSRAHARSSRQLQYCLRDKGVCMMCDMNVYAAGSGAAPVARIERGRSLENLQTVAKEARAYWQEHVCGQCNLTGQAMLCRPHLRERLRYLSPSERESHYRRLLDIREHLAIYDRSFVWEYRYLDSLEDRAALFSAIGWMSGWRPLLAALENDREVSA
jgi:hypothetical protein